MSYCTLNQMAALSAREDLDAGQLGDESYRQQKPPVLVLDNNGDLQYAYHRDVWMGAYMLSF